MTASPQEAIAEAARQSRVSPPFAVGMCLQKVRGCYEVPASARDASTAWRSADHKHSETNPRAIPYGVPVFWTGGSAGHGHIAISTGNGECWSTDIRRPGHFDHVPIAEIQNRWGMELAGWTEDINGVRVVQPPEEDMNADQLLDALDTPRGQAVLGKAVVKSLLQGQDDEPKGGRYVGATLSGCFNLLLRIAKKLGA